jgi:hypothetical protein
MITNFEEITYEITDEELQIVNLLIRGFKNHTSKNPIKAPDIVYAINNKYNFKLSEPRFRKLCNYIRTNSLLPLIATSKGYYCSYDKTEIQQQIQSLRERADAIYQSANGLNKFL